MSSLCRWVLSHKRIVVVSWIVLTLAGFAAVGPASNALRSDPTVPHREGWTTNATIAHLYGSDPDGTAPLIPVVALARSETVRTAGIHAELERVDARLRAALPTARIAPRPCRPATRPSSLVTVARSSRWCSRRPTRLPISARTRSLRARRAARCAGRKLGGGRCIWRGSTPSRPTAGARAAPGSSWRH